MARMLLLTLCVCLFGSHGVIGPRRGYVAPLVSASVTIKTDAQVNIESDGKYTSIWVSLAVLSIKGSADEGIEKSNARAAVDLFLSVNGFPPQPDMHIVKTKDQHLYTVKLDLTPYGTIVLYRRASKSGKAVKIAVRVYYVCDKMDNRDSVYTKTLLKQLNLGLVKQGAHKVALDTMHKELSEEERKAAIDALLASYNLNLEKDKDSVEVYVVKGKLNDSYIVWTVGSEDLNAQKRKAEAEAELVAPVTSKRTRRV